MRPTLKLTALATVFEGRITSLVPLPIRDGDNQPVHEVRASYADIDADELPADAAAWTLGRDNRFAQNLFQSNPALGLTVNESR